MMKKCECGGTFSKTTGSRKGIPYEAYRCGKCGEELMSLDQASAYLDEAKKAKTVSFTKWGQALGIRVPAEIVHVLGLKPKMRAGILIAKDGFRVTVK